MHSCFRSLILLICFAAAWSNAAAADTHWQANLAGQWRFCTGKDLKWARPDVDDSALEQLYAPALWDGQGYADYNGYGWYRKRFHVPSSLRGRTLVVEFGGVDDDDVVFINGHKVGEGRGCYKHRLYRIPEQVVRFGQTNLIAVRIYDGGMGGGLAKGPLLVRELRLSDRVAVSQPALTGDLTQQHMQLSTRFESRETRALRLSVQYEVQDFFLRSCASGARTLTLAPGQKQTFTVAFPGAQSPDYRLRLRIRDEDGEQMELFRYALADFVHDTRARILLSGEWEMLAASKGNAAFPPTGKWRPVVLPMRNWGGWRGASHRAWFRRTFDVPPALKGRRLYLFFQGVAHRAQVWVNGRKLADHLGGFAPFSVDFTDAAKPTANELIVHVTDWVAGLVEGISAPEDPSKMFKMPKDCMLLPYGCRPHAIRGIWQDVFLLARPAVHVDDVFVQTSVREAKLSLTLRVVSAADEPIREVEVRNEVWDGDQRVLRLPAKTVRVPSRQAVELTVSSAWPNPRLWWPHAPHLYRLRTTLFVAGKRIDQKDTRFGFREFWIDGLDYRLNGRIFKLRGLGCPPLAASREDIRTYFLTRKAANFSLVRFHMQPRARYYYEIADEVGMPVKHESAFYCASRVYALADERLWANLATHVEAMVRRVRSHPSVFIWSMENEILHCGGGRVKGTAERIFKLGQLARRLDPTRPIEYEGDGDLEGRAEVVNLHYPREFGCHNHNLWPNDAYWLGKEGNDRWPRRLIWRRTKPLVIGEFCFYPYSRPPGGLSVFVGEKAYVSREEEIAAHVMGVHFLTDGCRRLGVAGLNPWVSDLRYSRECLKPIVFTFRKRDAHFFARERVVRSAAVHNDTLFRQNLELRWSAAADGKTIAAHVWRAALDPGEMREVEIAWQMPAVGKRTRVVLDAKLLANGKPAHSETVTFWAFPRKPLLLPKGERFALYDPTGATARALQRVGVKVSPIANLRQLDPAQTDVLLVGARAFTRRDGRPAADALLRFVEAGGKAVVLEQTMLPDGLRLAAALDAKHASTIGHLRFPGHPVLKGLRPDDLRWWRGDHFISHAELLKPSRGRFRILAETGGRGGLKWTPLVEFLRGRGALLLCQLAIGEKLTAEPVAQVLLQNALAYAASFRSPQAKPTFVLAAPGSPIRTALRRARVRWKEPPAPFDAAALPSSALLIVAGDWPGLPQHADALARFARAGGAVLIHLPTRESISALRRLAPGLRDIAPQKCGGKLLKRTDDSPMTGLAHSDFFWHVEDCRYKDWEGRGSAVIDEPATHVVRFAKGSAVALTTPAALAQFPVGRGCVVVDLVRWDVAKPRASSKALRIASTLLANLGASFGKTPEPKNLSFVPLSLAGYFTAALRDEKPGDGRGGWTDQGSNDMRRLPRGRQVFAGVPYQIGDGCIALRSPEHLPHAPRSVKGIPVNGKFHYLFFLQAAAWCSDFAAIATWRVTYDDGLTVAIPIRTGDNIGDWWRPAHDLPGAKIAWSGSNPVHTPICLYSFRWRNPCPNRTIKSLAFESAETPAIPIVVAVTGARRK